MKIILFLIAFTVCAGLSAQTFTADVNESVTSVIIHDSASPHPGIFDTVLVSFSVHGKDCVSYNPGDFEPSTSYTFDIPYGFDDGFTISKETKYGIKSNGVIRWWSQTGQCRYLWTPDAKADTVYISPFVLNVSPGTYSVDWQAVDYAGGVIEYTVFSNAPADAKPTQRHIINVQGGVMVSGNLPAGIYTCITLWEWQGMEFLETDDLIIE